MRTRILSLWVCLILTCSLSPTTGVASEARETPLVRAVKRAQHAVVNIHSEKTAIDRDGTSVGGPSRKVNGMGTGIVVDERGYVVTNQHVIADVDSLRCTLQDGSTYTARVISYDRKHDLAIIKIDPSQPLRVIPLGTSSDIMLGETVIAVGNAFGYEHTVTAGIVSSLSRDVEVNEHQSYKNLLQTDASINPGNSGGPLLNLDGEVVGINVAIRAGAQRIGFAIPIDDARKFIARLLDNGRLNETYHGLVTQDVKTPSGMKLVVSTADSNSPAATAGFKACDIVQRVGPVDIVDQADLERAFLRYNAGESVEVIVQRDNAPVTLNIQLARRSSDVQTADNTAAQTIIRANNAESVDELGWRILGVRLAKVAPVQLEAFRGRYRGGMRVLEVRPESPAARHGIRQGDVLVGLHVWETISTENISYILNHPKLETYEPLKFYVLRGQETLFGNLRLTANAK